MLFGVCRGGEGGKEGGLCCAGKDMVILTPAGVCSLSKRKSISLHSQFYNFKVILYLRPGSLTDRL